MCHRRYTKFQPSATSDDIYAASVLFPVRVASSLQTFNSRRRRFPWFHPRANSAKSNKNRPFRNRRERNAASKQYGEWRILLEPLCCVGLKRSFVRESQRPIHQFRIFDRFQRILAEVSVSSGRVRSSVRPSIRLPGTRARKLW